jgi:hypothetical protein
MANDEPKYLIIYVSLETNDACDEQSKLRIDDDFDMNDASTTIEQESQVEASCDSVEVDKADKTTGAYGHACTDSADKIDEDNITNDGFEMNDASTIIGGELPVDKVTHKQMNTLMEGSSKNIEEQTTIEGGLKDMEELLTTVKQTKTYILCDFDDARNEESNPEEVEIDDGSSGYESLSANSDSSESSIKVSTKCAEKN